MLKLFSSIALALVFGLLYLFLIRVDINSVDSEFVLYSPIEQTARFHIRTESDALLCEGIKNTLDNQIIDSYWYHGEREVLIELNRGENHCQLNSGTNSLQIAQKITYLDYLVLFVLLVVPLVYLLFIAFFWFIDRLIATTYKPIKVSFQAADGRLSISKMIVFILLLAFALRIVYFQKFGILLFQHDWHGHIDFIQFMSQNWTLPIPTLSLQYPQQPLYYLLSAGLYSLFMSVGLTANEALYNIGYFSLFCSFLFLIYSYLFIRLLTASIWLQAASMAFLSFTPSIVYLSARINNDALLMMLSAMSLYYIVKSYQHRFERGFVLALISVSLLFLTKVSAASIEVLFFLLLLITYYNSEKTDAKKRIREKLLIFSLIGVGLLSFTLLRVYLPLDNSFHLVNSAKFPGQELRLPYLEYFSSFNIKELIMTGQSYVFGNDSIRHSFISYQYGTLFFGEFDYAIYTEKNSYLFVIMQIIYALGLVYILAFISYCFYLYREVLLNKILFLVLLFNFILILKFLLSYPSVCNTDFRYFVSSFPIIAFFLASGLEKLFYYKIIKLFISALLALLLMSELIFFYFLIYG